MAKLLYIEASPRKERSASIEVSKVFLDAYAKSHPNDQIEKLDLWNIALPEFNGAVLDAKYAVLHGESHTPEQAKAWSDVVNMFEQFKSADKYLISLPMWNFGIPYKLKHYIDVISQPGLAFSFSPTEGYKGLVTGKPIAVIYARGGEYHDGSGAAAYDLQKRYMELWLAFIGFTSIRSILVEPMLYAPEVVASAKTIAKEMATTIATQF